MLIGLLSIRERLRVLKMLNKNNKNCLRVSCPNGSELIELSNNKAEYYSDLAKKYTDKSYSHIGKIVGRRDHATVLHACKTIKDQIDTNKSFRTSVEEIESLLKG